jgi:hypothetical protein
MTNVEIHCQVVSPVFLRLYRISCIDSQPKPTVHSTVSVPAVGSTLKGTRGMHKIELIRQICGKINRETDQEKIDELLLLLNSVILNNLEDARIRMEHIRRRYAIAFEHATPEDMPDRGKL